MTVLSCTQLFVLWLACAVFANAQSHNRIESFDPISGEGWSMPLGESVSPRIKSASISSEPQALIQPILTTGSNSNRVTFVFLAEGFTTNEQASFFTAATNLIEGFLATPPFSDYKAAINAYAIFVPSNESGSDHPDSGIFKDTYFNSAYDTFGVYYATSIPPNDRDRTYENGYGKVDALVKLLPDHDISMMIVNDPAYGGSGGYIPMCSLAAASREIAIHEVAHRFAGLGDEYTQPSPGFPVYDEPNTTQETQRDLIKWNVWIDPQTPVPTPGFYASDVGLFEGARYFTSGWFRPQRDCKMRTLTAPFCAVCSEALVKSIYERVRPIDSFSPTNNPTISKGSSAEFSVSVLLVSTRPLDIQWHLNDAPISGATNSTFILDNETLEGTNTVKVVVKDNGKYVRNDPAALLTDSKTWTVNIAKSAPALTTRFDEGIVLSYPSTATNFVLQSCETLEASAQWQTVSIAPTIAEGQTDFQIPPNQSQQYFRLVSTNSL